METRHEYSGGKSHPNPLNFLESSLRYRQRAGGGDDVSEREEGEEEKGEKTKLEERVSAEKTDKGKVDVIKGYFETNPFTKSPEPETAREPAKNPYDENAILAQPPESDDYIDLLLRYQRDIEYMVKNGAHPSDIVDSKNDGFVDKKKSAPGDGNSAKLTDAFILKARQLEPTVKGMSIQDIVTRGTTPGATEAQRKQADSELTALAVLAALSLRNAFKISDTQLPDLVIQIKDIYVDHARQSEIAKVVYEYYTLQRKKKNRWHSLQKLPKDLYYTLSLSKRENRRYKKGLALILGKMEERREHLVERYPKRSKNKRGKRGREKEMLDELIKLKEECQRKTKDNLTNAVKAQLPYDRILREMEKVFGKCRDRVAESQDPNLTRRFEAGQSHLIF